MLYRECPECGGSGRVMVWSEPDESIQDNVCPTCKGNGFIPIDDTPIRELVIIIRKRCKLPVKAQDVGKIQKYTDRAAEQLLGEK